MAEFQKKMISVKIYVASTYLMQKLVILGGKTLGYPSPATSNIDLA